MDKANDYSLKVQVDTLPDHLRLRWVRSQRQGMGSGALAERLRTSLDLLRKLDVEIHPQSRAQSALAFHDRLNADPSLVRLGDPEFEALLEAHHRTAIDLFVITYMAWEDRRRPGTPFTHDKLELIVQGDDLDRGRDSAQRNMQFELYVAALLRLGGASVWNGEPDLRAEIAGMRVGIAVKRLRGTSSNTLEERVDEAANQIADWRTPGYIALSIDRRFTGVDPRIAEAELLDQLSAIFDAARYRRAASNDAVLGVMLFGWGYVIGDRPDGLIPLLSTLSSARWEHWSKDVADAERFAVFFEMWHSRMTRNISFLMSPEIAKRPL
jgi:hypothetical protein